MKANPPNGTPIPFKLPRMSVDERKLWAASHQLPAGLLLLYTDEVKTMGDAIRELGDRAKAWTIFGLHYFKADMPEVAAKKLTDEREAARLEVEDLERQIEAMEYEAKEGDSR